MSKRVRTVFLGIVLSLVLLTSLAVSGQPKSITFWLMPNAPDDTHIPWLEQKAAAFQAKTGVKVNVEIIGWDVAWQRITTAIATGEGADVFQVGTTWNPQLAATGGLEEIKINEFGGKNAFMNANYVSTTYKNKSYSVPWFAETRALFYNVDMFKKAGVQPPKTHDEPLQSSGEN